MSYMSYSYRLLYHFPPLLPTTHPLSIPLICWPEISALYKSFEIYLYHMYPTYMLCKLIKFTACSINYIQTVATNS